MLLSVIVPDKQPGMSRMLKKELEGINAEVINKSWEKGLAEAKGSYICFLEKNSAISPGTLRANLQIFLDKPAYRKLAMVSPMIDYWDKMTPATLGYNKGLQIRLTTSSSLQTVRIGTVPGAIIRTSSIRKYGLFSKHIIYMSLTTSVAFWENGLRIQLNPDTLYYAPEEIKYPKVRLGSSACEHPSDELTKMWEHEMIV